MEPILFFNTRGPYSSFSNFSKDPVTIFGRTWQTSEAAFQAMKYHPHRPDLVQKVFEASHPGEAAALGRDRMNPLSEDWESHFGLVCGEEAEKTLKHFSKKVDDGRGEDFVVRLYKDAVMYVIVLAKFLQDPEITEVLLKTGKAPIIEDTRKTNDTYWGWGTDMKGQNRLGKILMGVREVLSTGPDFAYDVLNQTLSDLNLSAGGGA